MFLKPNKLKNKLMKQYPFRIELHAHTYPASSCSEFTPSELVENYAKKGYAAIVITNHFTAEKTGKMNKEQCLNWYLNDYCQAKEVGEKLGIKVLLGAELRFKENHNDYLLFGADMEILSTCFEYLQTSLRTFRNEVKLKDSIIVQAHPFRDNCTPADASLLDGVECFNMHYHHNERNALTVKYAKENDIEIKTIGTDCHHPGQEGISALRVAKLPSDSFELAKILKSGDYILEICDNSIILP